MKPNQTIALGAILCCLSVAVGAFGAHALKDLLTETGRTAVFETAVKYQFFHALGIVLLGMLLIDKTNARLKTPVYLMLAGILVFSGSLYALCLSGITLLGAVTPFGGLSFMAAWAMVAYHFYTKPE